jgi:hypothetical protein
LTRWGLALIIGCVFTSASPTRAQGPIRIESQQVLVPVLVYNRQDYIDALQTDPSVATKTLAPWRAVSMPGLTTADFQVFEDGQREVIQNVSLKGPFATEIGDNQGRHYEYLGEGGGWWIFPDLPNDTNVHVAIPFPNYLLAYTPPNSPFGSCHRINVKLRNHPDAVIFSGREYCKTERPASDPLAGTKFGTKLEHEFASSKSGKIQLEGSAVAFLPESNATEARVHITVEFQPKTLRYERDEHGLHETIGLMEKILAKDGTELKRSSDYDCCDIGRFAAPGFWTVGRVGDRTNVMDAPSGYEVQLFLKPGNYKMQMLLSDGAAFGRTEIPITVEQYDTERVTISGLYLAKRSREVLQRSEGNLTRAGGNFVPLVSRGIEYTPTANTQFRRGESLFFFFELYEPPHAERLAPPIEADLRIVDAKTGAVVMAPRPLDPKAYMTAGNPIISIGGGTDISKLVPGSYRLEVQATDSSGQITPWKGLTFTIQ